MRPTGKRMPALLDLDLRSDRASADDAEDGSLALDVVGSVLEISLSLVALVDIFVSFADFLGGILLEIFDKG